MKNTNRIWVQFPPAKAQPVKLVHEESQHGALLAVPELASIMKRATKPTIKKSTPRQQPASREPAGLD